jgi:hypothetical protein
MKVLNIINIKEVMLHVDTRIYLYNGENVLSLQVQLKCGEILETKYLGYTEDDNNEAVYKYIIKYIELEEKNV